MGSVLVAPRILCGWRGILVRMRLIVKLKPHRYRYALYSLVGWQLRGTRHSGLCVTAGEKVFGVCTRSESSISLRLPQSAVGIVKCLRNGYWHVEF
jgi:hypothetical protein